jgi:hypothetical protein
MDQWNGQQRAVAIQMYLHVWISSIFVGFFKSSSFFCVTLYLLLTLTVPAPNILSIDVFGTGIFH